MRKQYDDFTQLKLKDMSKSISDMTYKYLNPETQTPTKVPPAHYAEGTQSGSHDHGCYYVGSYNKCRHLVHYNGDG